VCGGGGTLIELLIVVAIIGILIPTVGGARRRTHEVICRSNLKQMQTMWLMYIQQGAGRIPYTRYSSSGFNWLDALNSIQASDTVIW
jgi:Tfp pilus assembly protein PilE